MPEDAQEDEHPAERGGEKDRRIAVGEIQRTAAGRFTDRTQDQTQHDGGCVQIKLANEVADDAENEHDDHFHKVVVNREGTHNTQKEDRRDQNGVGQCGRPEQTYGADKTNAEHRKLTCTKPAKNV